MVRGGCKATITSNYTQTRLTPSNPTMPAQPMSDATANFNPYMGEIDALAMAQDGRVFYAGRAVCFQGQQQFTQWTHPHDRPRLRPDPRVRSARRRHARPEPGPDHEGRRLHGARRQGRRRGDRPHGQDRARHPRHRARPAVRRPGATATSSTSPTTRTTAARWAGSRRPRRSARASSAPTTWASVASRASPTTRRTKTLERRAGHPPLHDAGLQLLPPRRLDGLRLGGNLYCASGDNTGNAPNSNNGGYTNATRSTRPVPGRHRLPTYEGTGCGVDTSDPDGDGPVRRARRARDTDTPPRARSLAACGYIAYRDARQTSGNTNACEGKLLRITP